MNKADIARIRRHLENYAKLLQQSPYARCTYGMDNEAIEQVYRDAEKLKQLRLKPQQ